MPSVIESALAANSNAWVWVLIIAFCVMFILPLYTSVLANRKAVRTMYSQKEEQLLKVITANSEAMTRNTQVIVDFRETLKNNEERLSNSMKRIHDRLDDIVQLTIKATAYNEARRAGVNNVKQAS
jgi:flagellar basal body-associated protein FliL